jgi:hypothetical protein
LFLENLALPITDSLSRLALIFAVIIVIDLIVTGVLGTLEAIIERVTGHSATFQNGKLVALTKEDVQRLREQHRAKQEKERERQRQAAKAPRTPAGPPSFYKLPLPIPGAPGKEAVQPSAIASPASRPTPSFPSMSPTPPSSGRAGPAVITGTAVVKSDDELTPDAPLQEARIDLPASRVKPAPKQDEEKDDAGDLISDMLAQIGGDQADDESEDVDETGEADEAEERL